jgi:hypothetical protein
MDFSYGSMQERVERVLAEKDFAKVMRQCSERGLKEQAFLLLKLYRANPSLTLMHVLIGM